MSNNKIVYIEDFDSKFCRYTYTNTGFPMPTDVPSEQISISKEINIGNSMESINTKKTEEKEIITEDCEKGEKLNPIDAYPGLIYYRNNYYKDTTDNKVYKCYRDNDLNPGTGVKLDYLPHDLVGVYFLLEA